MKKLNLDEFQKRINETVKARKIFIKSGITNNITVAFQLYQDILADEEMAVMISGINTPFGNIDRPICDCGLEMRLDPRPRKIGDKVYPTTWVCKCGIEEYTDKTVEQWYEELKIEDKG